MELKNKQGKTLQAEILGLNPKQVRFRSGTNPTEHTVPLSSLSEETIAALQSAENIPALHPEYATDIIIGKRRKKQKGSFYRVDQTITSAIKIQNKSLELDSPGINARLLIFGQDQKETQLHQVLAAFDYRAEPERNKTAEKTFEPFVTDYDSDNEGEGNVGGYKYVGYIFLLFDDSGKIIEIKSLYPDFKKALAEGGELTTQLKTMAKGTLTTANLKPFQRP